MGMVRKILVAIDHSDLNQWVFSQALVITQAMKGQMLLVHVMSPFDGYNPPPLFPGLDGLYPVIHDTVIRSYMHQWDGLEAEGLELLRKFAGEATAADISVEYSQHLGSPGRVICEIARHWEADIIVLGRRGLSGVGELVMGSVSNYVMHHAPCSVLTVQRSLPADPVVLPEMKKM